VLGGRDVGFLRYYADRAIDLVDRPDRRAALAGFRGKDVAMLLIEQYFLSACVEFHRDRDGSPLRGVSLRYLFDSCAEAFRPGNAGRLGYTHLMADAKSDAVIARRMDRRVARDHPALHARALEVAAMLAGSDEDICGYSRTSNGFC
jgi:hypothetical protein